MKRRSFRLCTLQVCACVPFDRRHTSWQNNLPNTLTNGGQKQKQKPILRSYLMEEVFERKRAVRIQKASLTAHHGLPVVTPPSFACRQEVWCESLATTTSLQVLHSLGTQPCNAVFSLLASAKHQEFQRDFGKFVCFYCSTAPLQPSYENGSPLRNFMSRRGTP